MTLVLDFQHLRAACLQHQTLDLCSGWRAGGGLFACFEEGAAHASQCKAMEAMGRGTVSQVPLR